MYLLIANRFRKRLTCRNMPTTPGIQILKISPDTISSLWKRWAIKLRRTNTRLTLDILIDLSKRLARLLMHTHQTELMPGEI